MHLFLRVADTPVRRFWIWPLGGAALQAAITVFLNHPAL
jgi:hypothetical protein